MRNGIFETLLCTILLFEDAFSGYLADKDFFPVIFADKDCYLFDKILFIHI